MEQIYKIFLVTLFTMVITPIFGQTCPPKGGDQSGTQSSGGTEQTDLMIEQKEMD